MSLASTRLPAGYVLLADQISMADLDDLSVLYVSIVGHRHRSFRCSAKEVASIEANLSLANMDFEDFADNVDSDGVFRGFKANGQEPGADTVPEQAAGKAAGYAIAADTSQSGPIPSDQDGTVQIEATLHRYPAQAVPLVGPVLRLVGQRLHLERARRPLGSWRNPLRELLQTGRRTR